MAKITSDKNRVLVHSKFKGRCAYCGDKIECSKMHLDHIKPRHRGFTDEELHGYGIERGSNNIDNLNPSCAVCNISKSTFTIEVWRRELILKVDRLRKNVSNFRIAEKYNLVKVNNTEIIFYFEKFKIKGL